jgi:hypothetical protein
LGYQILPRDPDFPAEVQDARTGLAAPLEDTPFNGATLMRPRRRLVDGLAQIPQRFTQLT